MLRQGGTAMTVQRERQGGGPSQPPEETISAQTERLQAEEERPIDQLTIRLPKGIPFVLEFYDLRPGERLPVANNSVPMYVEFGSATVDMRGPGPRRMRDAIC